MFKRTLIALTFFALALGLSTVNADLSDCRATNEDAKLNTPVNRGICNDEEVFNAFSYTFESRVVVSSYDPETNWGLMGETAALTFQHQPTQDVEVRILGGSSLKAYLPICESPNFELAPEMNRQGIAPGLQNTSAVANSDSENANSNDEAFAQGTTTITSVPEPPMLLVFGFFGGLAFIRRRRSN